MSGQIIPHGLDFEIIKFNYDGAFTSIKVLVKNNLNVRFSKVYFSLILYDKQKNIIDFEKAWVYDIYPHSESLGELQFRGGIFRWGIGEHTNLIIDGYRTDDEHKLIEESNKFMLKIAEIEKQRLKKQKQVERNLRQIDKEIAKIKEQMELEESIIQPNIEQLEFERSYLTESEDQANKLYDEIKSYQEKYNALGTLNLIQKKELKNIISKKTIEFNEMVERARKDREIYNKYLDDQINILRINLIPLEKELENKNEKKNKLLDELNRDRT